MGCTVAADKSQLAGKLAECCHLLRVPGGDPQGYLHLHGVPSGTKPSGAETSGSMIPQPEVISKKGTRKSQRTKTRSARSRKRMRISVLKPENASLRRLLQGKKMKTLRTGNADAADITRQEFRLLQAELREYGFRTEIAGYDALRLHTESRMLLIFFVYLPGRPGR